MRNLFRRGGVEMHIGQQIGIRLVPKEASKQGKLRIGETVVRHGGCWIVDARVVQPRPQPLRFDFGADAGQFRTNVTTHHVPGGVLHGMAGGAE